MPIYSAGLVMLLVELIFKKTGYILPILSVLTFIGATIYAIFLGASYIEIGIIGFLYLLSGLITYLPKKEIAPADSDKETKDTAKEEIKK